MSLEARHLDRAGGAGHAGSAPEAGKTETGVPLAGEKRDRQRSPFPLKLKLNTSIWGVSFTGEKQRRPEMGSASFSLSTLYLLRVAYFFVFVFFGKSGIELGCSPGDADTLHVESPFWRLV